MKKKAKNFLTAALIMPVIVLSVFLCFKVFPPAAALSASGSCGENVTYTFDETTGLLTISGVGEMQNYSRNSSPFYYNTAIKEVIINDGVTSIGDYAFQNCTSLTSVTIPDSVTSIGWRAFSYCTSLTSVTIPDSVTSIDGFAFYGCTSLTSITVPDSVTSIGSSAFSGCTLLNRVDISSIEAWCGILFNNDSANPLYYAHNLYLNGELVTDLVIPDSVTSIGNYAFSGCRSLTSVTISDSVKSIGWQAFSYCTSLTSTTIGNSVTSIDGFAFYGCTSLTSITVPDSVTSIGSSAFSGCTLLNRVDISSIEAWCGILFNNDSANPLYYAHNLYLNGELVTDLVIPDSVTSIGNYAFSGCRSLTSVTIPDSVTSIGGSAFSGCTSLTSVTIPDSVTSIGGSAFSGCTSLTSVTIPSCVTKLSETFPNSYTKIKEVTINDGVTNIISSAFSGCISLTSVTIPDSVTSIGDSAFSGCTSLTSITIPDSVTSIGSNAFYGCTSLTSVIIPDSVTSIGDYAFYNCTSLTNVTIPDSVTSIGSSAYGTGTYILCYKNSAAHTYAESNGNTYGFVDGTEEENTFSGQVGRLNWKINRLNCTLTINCSGAMPDITNAENTWKNYKRYIHNVVFEGNITSIGGSAFSGCTSLTSVTIPDSVTIIGSSAFSGCTSLNRVDTTSIEAWCGINFDNTTANPLYYAHNLYLNGDLVTDLVIPDGVTSIGGSAFSGCTSLTSVTIPYSVKSIGGSAFQNCTSLNRVNISSIEAWCRISFGYVYLFTDYSSNPLYCAHNLYLNGELVTDLVIPDGVTSIGSSAFSGCTLLTSVTIPDSVTSIGDRAFYNCTSLTSATIGNNVTSIGDRAFNYCTSLNRVDISSIKAWCCISFSDNPLWYAHNLYLNGELVTDLVIPDSVTSIGDTAFRGCTSLTSVTIPYSVKNIDGGAFYGCSSLGEIRIYGRNCSIGEGAVSINTTIYGFKGSSAETFAENNGYLFTPLDDIHQHDYKVKETVAPTCTKDGYTLYICKLCGNVWNADITPALNHEYVPVVTAPTCTEPGYTTYTCSRCGDSYTADETPAAGHQWNSGKVTKAATYTATGVKTYTCTVCGKTRTETIAKKTVAQVKGLKTTKQTTKAVTLSWSKAKNADKYIIYRSTDGKKWTKIATTTKLTYTDSKLKAGAKYQYKVKGYHSASKTSGNYSAVLKTGTVTGASAVTLKSAKSKTATATWKKVTGASKYIVYKSTNGKKWTKVTTTSKLTYTFTKLSGGKKIYVKVTAVNAYGKASAASKVKSVTVKK